MPSGGGSAKSRKAKEKEARKQNKGKNGKKENKAQKQESTPESQASPLQSPTLEPQEPKAPQGPEKPQEPEGPQEKEELEDFQELEELDDPEQPQESDELQVPEKPQEPLESQEHQEADESQARHKSQELEEFREAQEIQETQEPQRLQETQHPPPTQSVIESLPPLPDSTGSSPSATPVSFKPASISWPNIFTATQLEKQSTVDTRVDDILDKDDIEDEDNESEPEEPREQSAPSPASAISSAGPATPAAVVSNNPFDAPDNTSRAVEDSSAPLKHPPLSAAEVPPPSPSLSEVKPRSSPAASCQYIHCPSPAPIVSHHYSFGSPVVHPYTPAMIPPHNGAPVDPKSMAVTTPNYHTSMLSSTMNLPYNQYCHATKNSRTSFGRGYADPYYNHYGSVKEPALVQQPMIENVKSASSGEGLNVSLLSRIQSIIPDISQLVVSYRDQQSHMSAREAEHKQIEAQHEESLMRKEFYIEALQMQMQKTANESAKECSKLKGRITELRFELGGLQEIKKDIENSLAEAQKENNELSQMREDLQVEIDTLQRAIQEAKEAHEQELEKQQEKEQEALAIQKQELEGYFEEIKNEDDRLADKQLKAREKELMDERDSLKAEWEAEKQALEEAKAALATEYEGKLKSKQADFDAKQADVDAKQSQLEAKQAELDTTQEKLIALKGELETIQGELGMTKENLVTTQCELETKKGELETMEGELKTTKGELTTTHAELATTKADLETTQGVLDTTKGDLVTARDELEMKRGELEDKEKELKDKQGELDATQGALDSKQSELKAKIAELEGKMSELDVKNTELQAKQSELDSVQNELTSKQTELESNQAELDTKEAELNEMKKRHVDELDALNEAHDKERNAAAQEAAEKIDNLINEYQQKEEAWQKAREDLETQLAQRAEDLRQAGEEKKILAREGQVREDQLRSAIDGMRISQEVMGRERDRLKKTLHSLGEATDMKMKGDGFFIQCFGQLLHLIVDLSKEHFGYLPIDPPSDIIAKIPSEIPQFLDNSQASRELRSAYIQHVISKTLNYRIFQPFLFTLGRRYDKADTFFQMLSMDIRCKSVRREAYWRKQTLKAAYTTSDAKQAINVVAAVIVDEIIDHIRHFADPKNLDTLLVGVRKIVKLAAETWRLARVERELIISTMPSAEDEQTTNQGWKEFNYDTAPSPPAENTGNGASSPTIRKRRVLLRMFPRIYREPAHEDFTEDGEQGTRCVYLPGVVLYADSPSVLARKMELSKKMADPSGSRSGTPAVDPAADDGAVPPGASDLPLDKSANEDPASAEADDDDVE
ncbi:hypothetical protein ACO22_01758 [Paracoccidioides brasiliensis]|uniref:RNA polymerase Rpb1 C-terminal repeat domain-containing protein n=1 Tax=Paracoccidioides brasiliensis TaxID=121759 RepID=A0A1D2JKL5_PARBR|nr:hypothetical protein ACO22_01758 [Paracoccidioides brasiliensis]